MSSHRTTDSVTTGEDNDTDPICTIKNIAADTDANFSIPIDEQLIKSWSGYSEVWFEGVQSSPDSAHVASNGAVRILGAHELKPNRQYLLKGRSAAIAIQSSVSTDHGSSTSTTPVASVTAPIATASGRSAAALSSSLEHTQPSAVGSSSRTSTAAVVSSSVPSAAIVASAATATTTPGSSVSSPVAVLTSKTTAAAGGGGGAMHLNSSLSDSSGNPTSRPPLKIIVVGDPATGKTTYIKKYCKGHVERIHDYKVTLGVDFSMALLNHRGHDIKLTFWDIAGQERYAHVTRSYYQGATGAFVFLDILNDKTYEGARRWKADIDAKVFLKGGTPIPCILLANKSDQLKKGLSPCRNLDLFARENNFVAWLATSSFTNTNVKHSVSLLVEKMLQLLPEPQPPTQQQQHQQLQKPKDPNTVSLTTGEPNSETSFACCK